MSLHSFWEKFDLLTDGPNGATKLRELILELAIRGKLVSQDPREKSASTFLREIASSNVNKRTGDTSDLTKSASIPFEIPQSWQWTSLLSLGHDWGQKKPNVEFTYIDVSSIDNEKGVITRKVKRMNPREAPSRARKIVKLGTVLYSTVRPYLLNIAIVDEEYSPEPIASTAFAVIHPFEGISAKYLFYYLRSRTFIDFVEQQMQGVAYPAINDEKLFTALVPLPPSREQQRIVAKVDELMRLCNQLEERQQAKHESCMRLNDAALKPLNKAASLTSQEFLEATKRLADNVDRLYHSIDTVAKLRSTILRLAVQGKLVAQNSADEPALSMLSKKHALPANYKRMKKRIKDSPVALPVHLFPPVPRGWVYESIQKLYDQNVIIDYGDGNHGELYPRKGEFTAEGVTFVTAAQIAGGKVQWPSCLKLAAAKAKELTKGWAGGEDVLLTHNATVGRAAIVEADVEKFLLGTSVTFYRLNSQVLSNNYFYLCLISPIWQDQLSQVMQQTTRNQVSIQKQAFFRIPIPPIEEQKRIVAKVSQLMSLCDEVEAKLCEAETTSQKLLNAVVHHVLRAVESVS